MTAFVDNITIISDSCTGCGSCVGVCPVSAIRMVENSEGFLFPLVDKEKCINCGKCLLACPVHSDTARNVPKSCNVAILKDFTLKENSSSGGVFVALAKSVINLGGYVCGAVYNEKFEVEHILTKKLRDIYRMQGSKYVQSDLKNSFKEIKDTILNGNRVLFVGTPCQVAGLNNFLDSHKVDKALLYTCDLVCYGTPSPKVFRKSLQELIPPNEKILHINMRKRIGKKSYYNVVTDKREYCYPHGAKDNGNLFMQLFFKNVCLRKSCSECLFANNNRVGDITLGDFWGIQEFDKSLDPSKGISCVLINTIKGEKLLLDNEDEFSLIKSVPLEYAVSGQPRLRFPTNIPTEKREKFFSNLDEIPLSENYERVLGNKSDCKIINYWFAVNYGAALTCYALKKFIEKKGLSVKTINFVDEKIALERNYHYSKVKKFAEKYLELTSECQDYESLLDLNKNTEIFVVGSDQVWRPSLYKIHGGEIYQLSFVEDDKKKIAFAASFGANYFDGSKDDKKFFRDLVKRFDSISVREKEALGILEQDFGISSGVHVLDPIFSLEMSDLNELSKGIKKVEQGYVGVFKYLRSNYKEWCSVFETHVGLDNNLPVKEYVHSKDCDIEEFVGFIRDCKILITDSFHAVCLAILYRKPFVILGLAESSIGRMISLLETLGLDEKFLIKTSDMVKVSPIEKARAVKDFVIDSKSLEENLNNELCLMNAWFESAVALRGSIIEKEECLKFKDITQIMLLKERRVLIENCFDLIKKMPQTVIGLIFLKIAIKLKVVGGKSKYINKKNLYSNRIRNFKRVVRKLLFKK